MSQWQYSPDGRRRLVRRAGRQSLIISAALLVGGALYTGFRYGWDAVLDAWPILAFGLFLFTGPYYVFHRRRIQTLADALRVELTPETLTVDNGQVRLSVTPQQVRGLYQIPEGVRIKGHSLHHIFIFHRELENFDGLRDALEEWVPPDVERKQEGAAFGLLMWATILGPVALMFTAFAINDPIPGAILCFLTAGIYLAAGIFGALSPAIPKRTRWFFCVVILPIYGLVHRAITHLHAIGI